MSPVGGVGINLAIQDAVATANALYPGFRNAGIDTGRLSTVQRRRMLPTQLTQALQVFIQKRVLARVLASAKSNDGQPSKPPLPLQLLTRFPILQRIPAYVLGVGVRREHVHTPERASVAS
jgi:2-polyprenyl-6-methoxyphenol hydroxylase-like FAD-dependent oxidoreductase